MNYVQRKMIAFVASLAFALVYLPLRYQPYGLDLAICAGFTVTIFLNAKRKRGKAGLFFGEDAIPFLQLILGHAVALAALFGIMRLDVYAAPVLPVWLTNSLGNAPGGHPLPSLFRCTQTFMVFTLGFIESWWLTQLRTKEEKEAQKRVVWTRSAFDQRMSERLRLH